jgi:two-component sensor histidine kinase/TPR repeat protein
MVKYSAALSLFLSLFTINIAVAQYSSQTQEKIASLNAIIEGSKADTAVAAAYYELSEILYLTNFDTVKPLCEISKAIATKNLTTDLSAAEKKSFLKTLAGSLNNIGYVHKKYGEISEALQNYLEALTLQEEIGDQIGRANSLNNIAVIYESQKSIDNAIEYYKKALSIYQEKNYLKGIAATLNNLGFIYGDAKKDTLTNLMYYKKSLAIREQLGDKEGISNSLNNLGHIYSRLNENDKALEVIQKSLAMRKALENKKGIVSSLISVANIHLKINHFTRSKEYALQALKLAKEDGFPENIGNSAMVLKKIYHQEKNPQEELRMFELYIKMTDSLENEKTSALVYQQQLQYEKKKAVADFKNKTQLALAQKKEQKVISLSIAGSLVLVLIFSVFIFRKWRITQQQKMTIEKQRDLLGKENKERGFMMKEIHHRVKNNLQIVNSLLRLQSHKIKDENIVKIFEDAQHRIISMARLHESMYRSSDLKRIDIKAHFHSLITALIKEYQTETSIELNLQIEQLNIGMKTLVPLGLIINEMITNALKHAFVGNEKGTITVCLRTLKTNELELIVGDDGIGMPKDILPKEATSLGLELIYVFTEQLEGQLELLSAKGTQFQLLFNSIDKY